MDTEYELEFTALMNRVNDESLKLEKAFIVSLDAQPDSEDSQAPASFSPSASF